MLPNTKFTLITPHGFCNDNKTRHCDRRAPDATKKIIKVLEDNNYNFSSHMADKLRQTGDYNRKVTRNTPYRNKIREELINNQKNNLVNIILEIHSCPEYYPYYNDLDGKDIGLLSIPKYEKQMEHLSQYMKDKLNYDICTVKSTETNDIQWDTSECLDSDNTVHILIEFREGKQNTDEFYKSLIDGVVELSTMKKIKGGLYKTDIFVSVLMFIVIIFISFISIPYNIYKKITKKIR